MFKSGYIAIIGQPNVGKSTLLNALLGQKIAAVTPKPQTTRHRILGIKHLPQGQILFLDTPGIHHPHKSLNEYMMEVTRTTLSDADVFLFLIEAADNLSPEDEEIFKTLALHKKPILLVINKSDRSHPSTILHLVKKCQQQWNPAQILSISAKTEKGIQEVETEILKRLPEGPAYFPEDQVTDQTERFLAAEIIREKVMELTREEIPYSVTVQVEAFKEPREQDRKKVIRIRASIIAEKDSQKVILVGKGGEMIKKIGTLARKDLEDQLGQQVFLELFVKIEKDWSKDPKKVKELAYS